MTIRNFIMVSLITFILGCSNEKNNEYGVWANKNCELLRTKNSILFFERIDSSIVCNYIKFLNENKAIKGKIAGKVVFKNGVITEKCINTNIDTVLQKINIGFLKGNEITINLNGRTQSLKKIESVSISSPFEMISPNDNNIGTCLQQWRLGTKLSYNQNINSIFLEAGTNKHNYTFFVQEGFVYCRAARIRSNNNGTYFAQNIRLMSNPNEQTSIMPEDNLLTSSSELFIDNEKFNTSKCIYDEEGIYWSLIKFNKDTIFLNGCGGETYFVTKDERTLNGIDEWIKLAHD